MAEALLIRLGIVLDETPAQQVMNLAANWRNGANPGAGTAMFGAIINDVRTIIVHQTAGWPARDKAERFVWRYTTLNATEGTRDVWGVGTQYYISSDGTAFRLIDLPRVTLHGSFVNSGSVGVETGNLSTSAPPSAGSSWHALSSDAEDIPGAKVYVRAYRGNPSEADGSPHF